MSFQPVIPFGGYAGWAFLNRTATQQQDAHEKTPLISRETAYFTENISKATTAEDLIADRTLLKVALGAFGLQDDLNNKAFIRKVLEDGTLSDGALSNKLADKRYLELSKAFGFGDFDTANTQLSDFGEKIVTAYKTQQFEVAVGDQQDDLRLALTARREFEKISNLDASEDTKWFTIMGNPPLRKVVETALGLPASFAAIDLDVQLNTLKEKAATVFGDSSVTQFGAAEKQEEMVRLFLLRTDLKALDVSNIRGQTALLLLQNSARANQLR